MISTGVLHPIHVKSNSNTWIRVSGNTLKHDRCSSITERAIDNIGVSCDPTNVSHTRKDVIILWVVVKGILDGEVGDKEREGKRGRERKRERERKTERQAVVKAAATDEQSNYLTC